MGLLSAANQSRPCQQHEPWSAHKRADQPAELGPRPMLSSSPNVTSRSTPNRTNKENKHSNPISIFKSAPPPAAPPPPHLQTPPRRSPSRTLNSRAVAARGPMGFVDPAAPLLATCGGDTVKLFDVTVESGDPCVLAYTPAPGNPVNAVKWNHTSELPHRLLSDLLNLVALLRCARICSGDIGTSENRRIQSSPWVLRQESLATFWLNRGKTLLSHVLWRNCGMVGGRYCLMYCLIYCGGYVVG